MLSKQLNNSFTWEYLSVSLQINYFSCVVAYFLAYDASKLNNWYSCKWWHKWFRECVPATCVGELVWRVLQNLYELRSLLLSLPFQSFSSRSLFLVCPFSDHHSVSRADFVLLRSSCLRALPSQDGKSVHRFHGSDAKPRSEQDGYLLHSLQRSTFPLALV